MQSTDLADNLQELVDHLKTNTGSTAVYVGKVVKPFGKIKEGDNDKAHIDPNAVDHIQMIHANADHQFLVDEILKQDQGITYSLFLKDPDAEAEA